VDFLLAGKRFSLQGQGHLPGVEAQRLYLWKTFRCNPNSVPGLAEKLFGFSPEFVFGFTPEWCSESSRNAGRLQPGIGVRLQPGIVFGLRRNTQDGP
jgi:hypothetical protein